MAIMCLKKGDQFLYRLHKNWKQIVSKATPIESFTQRTKACNLVQNKWARGQTAHNCTSFYWEQKKSRIANQSVKGSEYTGGKIKEFIVKTKAAAISNNKNITRSIDVSQWLHRQVASL